MLACIIMHNMILEDEEGLHLKHIFERLLERGQMQRDFTYYDLQVETCEVENISSHFALQNNIMITCDWRRDMACNSQAIWLFKLIKF